jgi:hypothetical protein
VDPRTLRLLLRLLILAEVSVILSILVMLVLSAIG